MRMGEATAIFPSEEQVPKGGLSRQLLAGTSRVDITPAGRISMGGYGQRAGQLSRGVNDRLFAKALHLANGAARVPSSRPEWILETMPSKVLSQWWRGRLLND